MNKRQDSKTSGEDKKTTEVRMGREVPIVKNASSSESGNNAKNSNKKEELREDRASSLV